MKAMYKTLLPVLAGVALLISAASGASAQSLSAKVTGAWTLVSGSEDYPDGKKNMPWATGNMILEPTGHISLILVGKDQPKSTSVRIPVGPFVAYYGTYTVNEADNTLMIKVEHSGAALQDGSVRTFKISFNGGNMTTTASEVETPEGTMIPVNECKKAQ